MKKRMVLKNHILCICFVFSSSFLFGGTYVDSIADIELQWEAPRLAAFSEGKKNVLTHQYASYDEYFQHLPAIDLKIKNVVVDSVAVVFLETDEMNGAEAAIAESVAWEAVENYRISHSGSASAPVSRIEVLPFPDSKRKALKLRIKYFFNAPPEIPVTTNLRKKNGGHSVLAEGSWIKIGVAADGVYKITSGWLADNGIDPADIDPETIRLFGNGGKLLPQSNLAPRPQGLVENAIWVSGAKDGSFDNTDYIIFHGQGPDLLEYDPGRGAMRYQTHYYSDTSYYFLNFGSEKGKRIADVASLEGSFATVTEFDHLDAHEQDEINLLHSETMKGSGRELFGEKLTSDKPTAAVSFAVPDRIANAPLTVISSLVASSKAAATFTLTANDQALGQQTFTPISGGEHDAKGVYSTDTFAINLSGESGQVEVKVRYDDPAGHDSKGFLNFLAIHARRRLNLYGDQTIFRSIASMQNPVSEFRIGNMAAGNLIWDITDGLSPVNQQYTLSGETANFATPTVNLKKFVVFDPAAPLPAPEYAGVVANQDLRGGSGADMVIVTHKAFLPAAQRLADFRRNQNGITVTVATTEQIFNEFSSGSQDVTAIRDYIKYLYDRNGVKYLLLMGKGTFDYKKKLTPDVNFTPIYQSRNSVHPIHSYASDDYYGFLDDSEGEWEETTAGDHLMDIGVGRLPVVSLEEAENIVDKLIRYETSPDGYGDWRKEIYFVADDGDGARHQLDADQLARFVEETYPNFNVNKRYLDAFPQESLSGKAPKANQSLNEMIEKGALIVNYTGHGNMDQWTHEQILDLVMINKWKNIDKLPLFVTATCEFGRHDLPARRSGAETLLTNENGGAIALVTTSRAVYSNTNFALNRAFYHSVFELLGDAQPTLGQIFQFTKNNSLNGSLNRNFSLLGDPAMTLAYPRQQIKINSVKAARENEHTDTLRALQRIRVEGEVLKDEVRDNSFDGVLSAVIFDKQKSVSTFGNQTTPMTFDQWEDVIYKGEATVSEGAFAFEFIVPKNISYEMGGGKISLYAYKDDYSADAGGVDNEVQVGGSVTNAPPDDAPPRITLFMNDTTFRNGGMTGSDAVFIARLYDESGINISGSGLGQEAYAVLNDGDPIVMSGFYQGERDTFQKGWIKYPLKELEQGEHSITFKVWDTYNNSSTARIDFFVGAAGRLIIKSAAYAPNPFTEETALLLEHNRAGEDLEILVEAYSDKGELVGKFKEKYYNSASILNVLKWNGSGPTGKKLETGLYLFKVFVRSLSDGASSLATAKVVFIN